MDKTATFVPSSNDFFAHDLSITVAGHFLSDANYHLRPRILQHEAVFIYTYGGAGRLIVEGREHQIRPGEGLLLFPGYEHEYETVGHQWHLKWFHCRGSTLDKLKTTMDASCIPPTPFDEKSHVFTHLETLVNELERKTPYFDDIARAHALIILLELARQHQSSSRGPLARGVRLVQSAAAYIRDHLHRTVSTGELEQRFHMSPRQLTRLFRQHLGESPKQYALRAKVTEAKRLLYLTDMTVAEVARRVGVRDPYYFSRLFQQKTGQSPTAFRAGQTSKPPLYKEVR